MRWGFLATYRFGSLQVSSMGNRVVFVNQEMAIWMGKIIEVSSHSMDDLSKHVGIPAGNPR